MHSLDYSVWGRNQVYLEEPQQTKELARFTFLMEAIDYAVYATSEGRSPVVLRGPYKLASLYADGTLVGGAGPDTAG